MTTLPEEGVDEREAIEVDPHRPQYHFLPPHGWMNDPNGLIQWKGTYHLFYQHNPNGAFWGTMHWGHASSRDLIHWIDLPIALTPTQGTVDEDGCFSGCTVGNHGVPTIIYTGVQGEAQLACLATSDDDLCTWHKHPRNPVIAGPPPDVDIVMFRDHAVWNEVGSWFQLIGSGIRGRGGAALLYRSDDLLRWDYLHPLCTGDWDGAEPARSAQEWECPDFFALDHRYMVVVSVLDDGRARHAAYFLGSYEQHRFVRQLEGTLDFGDALYAPQSMRDAMGRRIMFGWVREQRTAPSQRAAGWSGVMSLPRVLSLSPTGTLMMRPVPELQRLRGAHHRFDDLSLQGAEAWMFPDVSGTALEIIAEFEASTAGTFGLLLRCSSDRVEETRIIYDCAHQRLGIDTRHSSLSADVETSLTWGKVPLTPDQRLRLHVFLDHSVVEVFANNVACTTVRIYPSRRESSRIGLFSEGRTSQLRTIDIWEMHSIWNPQSSARWVRA